MIARSVREPSYLICVYHPSLVTPVHPEQIPGLSRISKRSAPIDPYEMSSSFFKVTVISVIWNMGLMLLSWNVSLALIYLLALIYSGPSGSGFPGTRFPRAMSSEWSPRPPGKFAQVKQFLFFGILEENPSSAPLNVVLWQIYGPNRLSMFPTR